MNKLDALKQQLVKADESAVFDTMTIRELVAVADLTREIDLREDDIHIGLTRGRLQRLTEALGPLIAEGPLHG